jgi:hypothetical protein
MGWNKPLKKYFDRQSQELRPEAYAGKLRWWFI